MKNDERLLPENGKAERRRKRRFVMDQDVRYKLLFGERITETASGRTLDISSSGIAFTTESMIAEATPVEVSMTWPVLLHGSCPLKLLVYGCVIRSSEHRAAVTIDRYEFRTQGKSFQQPQAPSSQAEYLVRGRVLSAGL